MILNKDVDQSESFEDSSFVVHLLNEYKLTKKQKMYKRHIKTPKV